MKATHLIIALNVLLFAAMLSVDHGGLRGFEGRTLLEFGSLYSPLVRQGQWFRLVTAMFMHLNLAHLAMNMISLNQVGTLLEPHYGSRRFVVLYLIAGLGGWAVSLAWHWSTASASAGASGAIAGLIGAGAVTGHLIGGPEGNRVRDAMIRWAAIVLVFGLAVHADNAAHAGGLLAGAGVAWLYDRDGRFRTRRAARTLGLEAVLVVALVGGAFAWAARERSHAESAADLVNEGVELARAGKNVEAIDRYRRALALEPDEAIAHLDLALSLVETGDLVGAEKAARRAVALDPQRASAHAALAAALGKQGREDEAARELRKYKELGGRLDSP